MKNVRLSPLLGISVLFATTAWMTACEPVDDTAATRVAAVDPNLHTEHIEPGDREVFIDIDETMKVADGCAKTTLDAHAILDGYCKGCHGIGDASIGVPRFDFVLDDDKLKTSLWEKQGQPALRFVKPGDPMNSVVYTRAAIKQDMPQVSQDPSQPSYPRVTFSEGSVLYEWIAHCMGSDPLAATP